MALSPFASIRPHALTPAPDPFASIRPHPLNPAPSLPAPSLPAAPPPVPAAFVPPPDPGLDAAIAGYGATRDSNLAGLAADRTSTLLGYGYNEGADGSLAFDTKNPFSREALRRVHYDQARAGNTTNYAARGMLYSGALQNAQNETNRQDQTSGDELQKALGASLAGNTQQTAQTQASYGTQVGLAQSGSLGNWVTQQLKA